MESLEKEMKEILIMIEIVLTLGRMKTGRTHPKRRTEIGKEIVPAVMFPLAIDLLQLNFISETSHIRRRLLTYLNFSLVTMEEIMCWNVIFLRNGLLANLVGLVSLLYRNILPVKFLILVENAKSTAVY